MGRDETGIVSCQDLIPTAAVAGLKNALKSSHELPIAQINGNGPSPAPKGGITMATSPISAASLSQYVLQSSNSAQLQQTLQTLQSSLGTGDLNSAQSAFPALQTLLQGSATASGTSLSSQLSSDLTALGAALTSGDLSTAQSALATVQSDLKTSASPTLTSEANAGTQAVQLVENLLSTLSTSTASSSSTDLTTSILENVYASQSGLNVVA
jgi:hypothetical protein